MASWTDALKEYAKINKQFIVPKKDSDHYKAVKELQSKMKPKVAEPAPEVHPVTKAKIERRKKQSIHPDCVVPTQEESCKKPSPKKHAITAEVPPPAKPAPVAVAAVVAEEAPKRRPRKVKGEAVAPAEAAPAVPAAPAKRTRKERPVKVEIEQKPTILTF